MGTLPSDLDICNGLRNLKLLCFFSKVFHVDSRSFQGIWVILKTNHTLIRFCWCAIINFSYIYSDNEMLWQELQGIRLSTVFVQNEFDLSFFIATDKCLLGHVTRQTVTTVMLYKLCSKLTRCETSCEELQCQHVGLFLAFRSYFLTQLSQVRWVVVRGRGRIGVFAAQTAMKAKSAQSGWWV